MEKNDSVPMEISSKLFTDIIFTNGEIQYHSGNIEQKQVFENILGKKHNYTVSVMSKKEPYEELIKKGVIECLYLYNRRVYYVMFTVKKIEKDGSSFCIAEPSYARAVKNFD